MSLKRNIFNELFTLRYAILSYETFFFSTITDIYLKMRTVIKFIAVSVTTMAIFEYPTAVTFIINVHNRFTTLQFIVL